MLVLMLVCLRDGSNSLIPPVCGRWRRMRMRIITPRRRPRLRIHLLLMLPNSMMPNSPTSTNSTHTMPPMPLSNRHPIRMACLPLSLGLRRRIRRQRRTRDPTVLRTPRMSHMIDLELAVHVPEVDLEDEFGGVELGVVGVVVNFFSVLGDFEADAGGWGYGASVLVAEAAHAGADGLLADY